MSIYISWREIFFTSTFQSSSMDVNYYDILQVEPDADADTIKRSFNKLVKKYHPDINRTPIAEQEYLLLRLAYETLSDPEKRAYYDGLARHSTKSTVADEKQKHDISIFVEEWKGNPILKLPGVKDGIGLRKAKSVIEAYDDGALDDFIQYCEEDIEWPWDGYDIWEADHGPVLKLNEYFGFGKHKAEIYRKNIEIIQAFVAQYCE